MYNIPEHRTGDLLHKELESRSCVAIWLIQIMFQQEVLQNIWLNERILMDLHPHIKSPCLVRQRLDCTYGLDLTELLPGISKKKGNIEKRTLWNTLKDFVGGFLVCFFLPVMWPGSEPVCVKKTF